MHIDELKNSKTRSAVIYLDENGKLSISEKPAYDEVGAKRGIGTFDGRLVVDVVTFPWDTENMQWAGAYKAEEKLAGRIPCRELLEDGTIVELPFTAPAE